MSGGEKRMGWMTYLSATPETKSESERYIRVAAIVIVIVEES